MTENIYARVIADSVTDEGHRLTTMEIQCHRFVLAEFNTHRAFSRNSASSRAIPFEKQMERMEQLGIAYPLSWPREQRGMQGGEEFDPEDIEKFKEVWGRMARTTADIARSLHSAGLHKSVVNRLLEPYMWHKIIVSATEWTNFFDQRCSPLAQPEIREVAEEMWTALENSTPISLAPGEWHLPYIDEDDWDALAMATWDTKFTDMAKISAARCARVSYLTHDGIRSVKADLDLYDKLISATPPHWSPLEHVATPAPSDLIPLGNFDGWVQLRHAGL